MARVSRSPTVDELRCRVEHCRTRVELREEALRVLRREINRPLIERLLLAEKKRLHEARVALERAASRQSLNEQEETGISAR